jgi:formylglycine-generating enzyme required for sulfatase activity
MLAVRCPHCLHTWQAPPGADRLTCPVCGGAVVATPAAAVETGFSLPLPSSSTSAGAGCAPASVGGPHPFLSPPQGPGEMGRLGRYRVLRELGAGGMGVVFEAEDTRLDRRVALKVMRIEAAAHQEGRARFQREAKAAAALDHEHIVAVHDFGEENGAPYLVLPLLRGESLEARLKRQRPLPLAEALRIAAEMAEGLAAAHEANLVHRDVKPGNVWLTAPGGRVKLLDFGLARLVEGDGGMTRSGAVLGTPAYMSPEQAAGAKNVDARADLFSLGAVLYEMLTGRRAFRGDSWMEVLANRLRMKPPAPREVNADVPEEVSDLVMRLLAEEPAQRPSSARQVARSLRALAAPAAESLHAPERGRPARSSPPARRWPVVVGAAVVLLLGLAAGWMLRPGQTPRDEPKTGGPGPGPAPTADGSSALTFAAAWHDGTRAGLPDRPARRAAALAFGEGLHTAASARLLALHEANLGAEKARQERLGAALAFGDGLHTAATTRALALDAARLRAEKARLEAIARRQGEREAREAGLAFGGALHEAARAGAPVPVDRPSFDNSVGMKMIRIKAGRFRMGSPNDEKGRFDNEGPQHEVEISKAFSLAEATVTVGQFRRFVQDRAYHGGETYKTEAERDGKGGWGFNEDTGKFEGRDPKYSWKNTGWKQTDDHPVVNVTWNDAVAFCKWLSDKEKREYRLPTEAEWEFACRAGTTTRYLTGDEEASLKGYANVADASLKRKVGANHPTFTFFDFDDGFAFTAPVKSFKPNPWGLYDMHGNVWQWCADGQRKYETGFVRDPVGPEGGARVLRGGSWSYLARNCRAAYRSGSDPGFRYSDFGFRVACSPPR